MPSYIAKSKMAFLLSSAVALILILFGGCTEVENATSLPTTSKLSLEAGSVDTFRLTDQVGTIVDVAFDNVYGISRDKSTAWLIDNATKELRSLPLKGEGPNKIADVDHIWGFSRDEFIVSDIRGIYKFDINGKIAQQCKDLYKTINTGSLPNGFRLNKDEIVIPSLDARIPLGANNYYSNEDVFFVSKVNLGSCNFDTGGSVVENSPYKTLNLPVRERGLVEPLDNDKFILYFQYDKEIQILSSKDFSRISSFKIIADEFGDLRPAADRSLQERLRVAQVNPAIMRIKSTSDGKHIVVQYTEGSDDPAASMDYLEGTSKKPQRWIEVYDLDSKQRIYAQPIKFSDSSILVKANTLNEIYFTDNNLDDDEGTYLLKLSLI